MKKPLFDMTDRLSVRMFPNHLYSKRILAEIERKRFLRELEKTKVVILCKKILDQLTKRVNNQ